MMKVSVLIPAYNENKLIEQIIDKVRDLPFEKEIIVVNDCSTDGTGEILIKYEKVDGVKVVHHLKDAGKAEAIKTALLHASGDIAVIQDADLEYDPEDILKLAEKLNDGSCGAVYGNRFNKNNGSKMSVKQYLGNRFMTASLNILMGTNLHDMETCYKMMRMEYAKRLNISSKGFGIDPEITIKLIKMGAHIKEIPIKYYPRTYMEGKKIRIKDAIRTFYSILKFSIK